MSSLRFYTSLALLLVLVRSSRQAHYCPDLEHLRDGRFFPETKTIHGTRVRYECLYLTELEGAEVIECVAGVWTPPPPKCVVGECKAVDTESRHLNLLHGTNATFDSMEFECSDDRLTMFGESLITCKADKKWDKEPPFCAGPGVPPVMCAHVPQPTENLMTVAKGNYCYSFINKPKYFYDAKRYCEQDEGFLVHIPDKTTNDWLVQTLASLSEWNGQKTWIGLKDRNDMLQWTKGDDWVPLSEGSLDNTHSCWNCRGHCYYLLFSASDSDSGTWWRTYCCTLGSKKPFICQYPQQP